MSFSQHIIFKAIKLMSLPLLGHVWLDRLTGGWLVPVCEEAKVPTLYLILTQTESGWSQHLRLCTRCFKTLHQISDMTDTTSMYYAQAMICTLEVCLNTKITNYNAEVRKIKENLFRTIDAQGCRGGKTRRKESGCRTTEAFGRRYFLLYIVCHFSHYGQCKISGNSDRWADRSSRDLTEFKDSV